MTRRLSLTLPSRLAAVAAAMLLSLFVVAASTVHAASAESPTDFVTRFADEGLALLTEKEAEERERQEALRELLQRYFDVPRAGRITLGRHWRRATDDEKTEYGRLFEDYVVVSINRRMQGYSPDTLDVIGAREINEVETVVESRIESPSSEPVRIHWSLIKDEESWRILDVTIEGVSQVLTQRNEFDSVIRAGGGRVEALLERLREQAATLSASPS